MNRIHALTIKNKDLITTAGEGICLHCHRRVSGAELTEWTDNDRTAICPHCGIDAVVPDYTQPLLDAIQKEYF